MKTLSCYGDCTGPFGFPMKTEEAQRLDKFLQEHTKESALQYKYIVKGDAHDYFIEKDRADVSTITDGSIDKDNEVIDPKGVFWETFRKNPVVTFGHVYYTPPIGKSIWQTLTKGQWKAKTVYAERPDSFPKEKEWEPDTIWSLVKEGFLKGKSIGGMPKRWHEPTKQDISENYELKSVDMIVDELEVFEYAVVTIGSNSNALVEAVNKGLLDLSDEIQSLMKIKCIKKQLPNPQPKEEKLIISGITPEQYKKNLEAALKVGISNIKIDVDAIRSRVLGKV